MVTLNATPELPTDVRLMNACATVLAIIGTAGLAALALVWLTHRPMFAVQAIRVDGDLAHNNVLTIRANAAPQLRGSYFTLDLATARRAFESVPWVRQAVVRRVWPNRLAVQLQEHRAAAVWVPAENADAGSDAGPDEGADQFVNTFGEVFEANPGDVEDESLPTLSGPPGRAGPMLALLLRLQPVLEAAGSRVDRLELSGRDSWRVVLASGADMALGRGTEDELLLRTRRFAATLPELLRRYPQHPLLYADLRHVDGYAVRLKGISTTGAASGAPLER